MKKLSVLFVLILLTVLCACSTPNSQEPSSQTPEIQSPSAEISDLQTAAPSENNSNRVTKSYLSANFETDLANDAITAYNEFLSGTRPAIDKTSKPNKGRFFIYDMYNINLEPGIDQFALLDMNNDGIPELIVLGYCACDIFSYQDSVVRRLFAGEGGAIDYWFLENGAFLTSRYTHGYTYRYTTIDVDGVATTIEFGEPLNEADGYYFEGNWISKEEWEEATHEYLSAAENKIDPQWYQYED